MSSRLRRLLLASFAVGSLAAAGSITSIPGSQETAAAATASAVTITPNPAYQNAAFEGWGTSLAWFANATGGYPEAVRQDLFDKVFGSDGLNLNIARYNIGGGNATDVPPYLRAGGAVDGWWNPDITATDAQGAITSTYADRDRLAAAWDADDPASYDFSADATQRWWVDALKEKITKWEAFSNSPPYFMTNSGYVSGNFTASSDQLKTSSIADYVTYLKTVVQHIEQTSGITFDSIDPFNEPNTNYWGTNIDSSTGWPKKGGQEGAHMGPALQDTVIKALQSELAQPGTTTGAHISAMDETNPSIFMTDWNGWSQQAKAAVDQLNVHTYGTSGRTQVRDVAKANGKDLWMSEVEGDWDGTGVNNQTNINNGIGMATRITDDLRELEPSAWIFWQPVEDYYNMQKVEKLNWGSIDIDFDCNADGNSVRRLADGDADPSCRVVTNAKYNTVRNFTHYIRPGDHIIPSTNAATTAALAADGGTVTLVHTNAGTAPEDLTIDLSKFGAIDAGATVTPIVTTESPASDPTANALVQKAALPVDAAAKTARVTVPAKSVTTLVVTGVHGVAETAVPLQDGHTYQLRGVQSGKNLTGSATGAATITSSATTTAAASTQAWTVRKLTSGAANIERYTLQDGSGRYLTATSAGTAVRSLADGAAASDPSAQWMLSTVDGARYSLLSVAAGSVLDVGGQSTAENASVGVYGSNTGANQLWTIQDTQLVSIQPVAIATLAGSAPSLPATVVPVYRSGAGSPVAVTWDTAGADWSVPGTVTLRGSGTDLFGHAFDSAVATVDVGGYSRTDPVSLTTFAGVSAASVRAAAPATVPAHVGTSGATHDAAVTWDWTAVTDAALANPGVVTVRGTAVSNDPAAASLPATLSLIVTTPSERNVATDTAVKATATSTESGYSADNTRNGVTTDKGWSNWVSTNKPTSSTLTYDLGGTQTVNHVTIYAYKDGSTTSWPSRLTVQYADASGTWIDAPDSPTVVAVPTDGSAPIVDVPIGGVSTSKVRVVMTAYANTHLTIAEVQIYARTAGAGAVASLAALTVGGEPVAGFATGTTEYSVPTRGAAVPELAAVAVDGKAGVAITQPSAGNGHVGTVVVTSEDGTATETYTVALAREIALTVADLGGARVAEPVAASATVDPADAALRYTWLVDGVAVVTDAADASYTPQAADEGLPLSVSVSATAEGYTSAAAVSNTVVVGAKAPEPAPAVTGVVDAAGRPIAEGAVLTPGDAVTVTVAPTVVGTDYALEFHSTPVTIAQAIGDGSAITLQGTVPVDATAGAHRLVVRTPAGELWSIGVTVAAVGGAPGGAGAGPVSGLADTGSGLPLAGGALALLLIVGGAAALLLRARRRREV
ncbi:glycoside hydrolase [Leifsonia sp. ZF2019]|uniref:glycoside hydrolase n=1 Tax=Leifsonia sp. ZF2019 TaxID=2781978 RepID=UPI001CBE6FA8|nr:glycoside hydrolase [Leifsonia sp. ZF2019]